ncbi:hypothetical protein PV08_02115 [Exophiala spinifera]|uniref:Fungal N-terminal domain-containing protein n=1 Tax=Exophiala spinifera TaxID=91928 RepID=A0A0D2BT10_9EURO|nr:uncharacterized protein PV08_02115 [Exophiala spinifera]KIW21535.1 hypothetical protein PV08_02115 [Exophiala spinifera]
MLLYEAPKACTSFFQEVQDAGEQLPQIRSEISYLQHNLSSLRFLSEADEDTINEAKATGIIQSMNECGVVCDKFTRQLTRWTSSGVDRIRGKLKFKLHGAQIAKARTRLWATARMLEMTIGILTLKLVAKSQSERATEKSLLQQAIHGWKRQAEKDQENVSASLRALGDSDDSGVIDELEDEEIVLKQFVETSSQTLEQIRAIKLNQTITYIKGDDSRFELGMPVTVVDKVAQQTITHVEGNKSVFRLGIFKEA